MKRHHFEMELVYKGHELNIEGYVLPGCPERGPTYDCGGTPAEPAELEDLTIRLVHGDKSREIKVSDHLFDVLYEKIIDSIRNGD